MKLFVQQLNRTIVLTGLCLSVFSTIATVSVVQAAPGPGGRATPVVVQGAKLQRLAPVTFVSGTVISLNDARLATEVEGQVKKLARVGKRVKEGDVIARVDDTFTKLKIEELKAAVQREKAQLDFEREETKRLKRLARQNNAARTRLEQTQANRAIARNNLNIARTRLKQAKEELWRHTIRAPFSGVIAERFVRRGERVDTGDEIVRLIDPDALEVQARVPLNSSNFVREGDLLQLTSDIGDGVDITGTIRTIVPVGNERSRLMDLRLDFSGANWRVGQQVKVALPTASPREVMAVPRDALVLRRNGAFVFRVKDDGSAEKIAVKPGIAAGDLIEVKGDINAGDQIVTRGGERLRPGQKVKILSTNGDGKTESKKQDRKKQSSKNPDGAAAEKKTGKPAAMPESKPAAKPARTGTST